MNSSFNKKRRPEPLTTSRVKQSKGPPRSTVEDMFPFEGPFLETLAPQIKLYVSELQRQYIQRYNILMNNRTIYQEIVENISTELDQKGVTIPNLMELYRNHTFIKAKNDDNNL